MKLLRLLEGLYTELKRLNGNLERISVASDHALKEKQEKSRLNPMKDMTIPEILRLKIWIKNRLEEKGLLSDVPSTGYVERETWGFLEYTAHQSTARIRAFVAATLGYADFVDLVEDWRKREGCKA